MTFNTNIMVIDGEDHTRNTLALLLKGVGFTIVTASTASAALSELSMHPSIQLVFLDFELPDMDGGKLLSEIRESFPCLSLVVLTAGDTPELYELAHKLGVSRYIRKPIDPEKILSIAKSIIDEQAGIPQSLSKPPAYKRKPQKAPKSILERSLTRLSVTASGRPC